MAIAKSKYSRMVLVCIKQNWHITHQHHQLGDWPFPSISRILGCYNTKKNYGMRIILFLEWVSNLLFQRDIPAIMTDSRIRNGDCRIIVYLCCRFYPKFEVKTTTISVCRSTIAAFTNGDMAVYQRIQKFEQGEGLRPRFDNSVTPLDFMFRQLFHRLFIVSPAFIRVCHRIIVF